MKFPLLPIFMFGYILPPKIHTFKVSNMRVTLIVWSVHHTCHVDRLKCPLYVSLWPISVQHNFHSNHDRPCRSCGVCLPASYYQGFGSITGPTIWDLYRTSCDTVLSAFFGFPCHYLPIKAPYSFKSHPCVAKLDCKTQQYHNVSHRIMKITTNKTKAAPFSVWTWKLPRGSYSTKDVCVCAVDGLREEWQFLENREGTSRWLMTGQGHRLDWHCYYYYYYHHHHPCYHFMHGIYNYLRENPIYLGYTVLQLSCIYSLCYM